MCQSCFDGQWDGRESAAAFLEQLPRERLEKMVAVYDLTRRDESSDGWMSGPLHAAIDDDNYDCGCASVEQRREWRLKWEADDAQGFGPNPHRPTIEEEDETCAAWDELSEDERAIVVAWRSEYWVDREATVKYQVPEL